MQRTPPIVSFDKTSGFNPDDAPARGMLILEGNSQFHLFPRMRLRAVRLFKDLFGLDEAHHDDAESGPEDAVRIPADYKDELIGLVCSYAALPAPTPSDQIPRVAVALRSNLNVSDINWLESTLRCPPGPLPREPPEEDLRRLFDLTAFAEFLGYEDLSVLLAGVIASYMVGKTTEEMRRFLRIETDNPLDLFSPDTLAQMKDERKWLEPATFGPDE